MNKCLILVDYQVDFVCGSLGFENAADLDERIVKKINEYRNNGDKIIFTFDTHNCDYYNTQEGRLLPVEHCIVDTKGHNLYGKTATAKQDEDLCFCKSTYGSDKLFDYLKNKVFDSIELCGLVSNICVISNAVLAKTAQPETKIIVDSKCTASNDKQLNQAALDVMRGLQILIV